MKSFLLSTSIACTLLIAAGLQQLQAQACSVSNITVKLNSASTSGGTCQVNIDLSWDQTNNNGNKFTNVHLWTTGAYPNPALTYSNPPTAGQLTNALGTIVINNPTSANPGLNANYPPATSVTILPASGVQKVVVGSGAYRFTIKGIQIVLPNACNVSTTIKADIWSSNSASDNGVQCFTTGNSFVANDPVVNGTILCNTPRQFVVNISSLTNFSQQATYTVYSDLFPFGTLDASDPVVYTSGTITIPASGSGTYSSGPVSFTSNSNSNLWVRVQITGNSFSTTALLTNTCAPLPITLLSFTAQRQNNSGVLLKWETSSEQNNSGFDLQRKTGNGSFTSVAFIPSAARNGNSNSNISYQYLDQNNSSETTQYRLAQTDFDGRQSFSPIVLVRGLAASGLDVTLYPNPSPDGNVTVVFSNSDRKDIQLTDGNGRIIKMQAGISTNRYMLNGLRTGLYFLKITQPSTGESKTEKIMVR